MGRPVDWSPLADSDPVPGDPEVVARAARHYGTVAEAIRVAVSRLRAIADAQAEMDSDAVAALRDSTYQVAGDIEPAHERYAGASQALSYYSPALDDAQHESLQALWQARQAQDELQHANNVMAWAQAELRAAPPGADTSMERGTYLRAHGSAEEASDVLADAARRLERAVQARNDAGDRAAAAFDEVVEGSDLNDGWYENWGQQFLAQVARWAGRIGAIAGVLSMFLGWVPVIGPALFAVAGLAAVVSLVATSVRKAHGDASWLEVSIAAVAVFTAGVGKAASAFRAARVASTSSKLTRASEGAYGIGRAGMRARPGLVHSADEFSNFAGWGGKLRAVFKTGADEFIGGRAIRDFRFAQSVQRRAAGRVDADELLRQARQIKAASVTELGANYTGHGLTAYGAVVDIRGSARSSPPPEEQLNLARSETLRDEAQALAVPNRVNR